MSEPSFKHQLALIPKKQKTKKTPSNQEHYQNHEVCESKSVNLPYWDPLNMV